MDTVIYIVRHGHVHNPGNIVYARLPRFRLSETGREQAKQAARALAEVHPAIIFTSPMLRARQTAGIIALEHPGVPVRVSTLINENFTPYQGVSFEIIEQRKVDIFAGVESPYEQPSDLLRRSLKFIHKVQQKYPGQSVIAVTHGDIVRVIIRWALGLAPERGDNEMPFPGTGSVTALVFHSPDQEKPTMEIISSSSQLY